MWALKWPRWMAAALLTVALAGSLEDPLPQGGDQGSEEGPLVPVLVPISLEGVLAPSPGVCAEIPGVIKPCVNAPRELWRGEVTGNVTALDVNLTWDAVGDLSRALSMRTIAGKACPDRDNCVEARALLDLQRGPSPLRTTKSNVTLEPGESLWRFIQTECPSSAPCLNGADQEQPLRLNGTVWTT